MSVTVIFVFAEGCHACHFFKEKLYSSVLEIYERKAQTKTMNFTAPALTGWPKGQAPYAFLEEISYFPCVFCVKSELLELYSKNELKEDILNRLFLWNGAVTPKGPLRIKSITPGNYSTAPHDIIAGLEKFYNDFLETTLYKDPPATTSPVPERKVIENSKAETSSTITSHKITSCNTTKRGRGINTLNHRRAKMDSCRGITPIPITKK